MVADFDFVIENEKAFKASLDRLGAVTSDFRIPFMIIASDFYRSQRKLFKLAGPGLYDRLGGKNASSTKSKKAEKQKERTVGFAYPVLVGKTQNLSRSTLTNSHRFSHFKLTKRELEIGTKIPYGKFHQFGTKHIPIRKFIFIDGGPADRSKDSSISGRRERWINIVEDHITQLVTGRVL